MKILIAVLAFAIAVQTHITEEQKIKLKKDKETCITSTGVKAEDVEKTKKGEFVDDPLLNEFLFCFGKMIGFLNEAGEFQKDVMKAKIVAGDSVEDAEKLIVACTAKTQDTPQLTSLEFAKCSYEQYKAHFKLA